MAQPSSETADPSSPPADAESKKSFTGARPSKVIILKLSTKLLARFVPKSSARGKASARSKSLASSHSTPVATLEQSPSVDVPSDSNSTPAPVGTPNGTLPSPSAEETKRKGVPGPKPGSKRALGGGQDSTPKARGKPGPKKKPRLEDGTIDHADGKGPVPSGPTLAPHKLGPKANQGAINAGLRALDRSGNPCRRWEKKGFQLKSFTGVLWQVPTWRTPKPRVTNGDTLPAGTTPTADVKSSRAVDSDSKENKGSSAVESEKSNSGGDIDMTIASNIASSPAPATAASA
ncbi:MAG: hypothetical protein M1825_000409 [Sarcosagium campestre]|nr:MAG: hypothetical protein M1825_000409 [Sarcosagium campestre]